MRAKNHTHKNTLLKNTHTIPKKKKKKKNPLDPLFKRPAASHEKDPKKKKKPKIPSPLTHHWSHTSRHH